MRFLITFFAFILLSSNLYAEFRMERVICTTKKTSNCGAYIYNSRTGEVYFCDSEKCKELDNRLRKWKPRKINFGNGTLWKYAQTVGPAYLGAPTHPGAKTEVKVYADI